MEANSENNPNDENGLHGKNLKHLTLKKVDLKKIFNKKFFVSFIGFLIIIFTAIGISVTVKHLYIGIVRMFNNSAEKESFERYILPVMMFDPVPFETPQKADKFSLLQSAIWAAFMDNGKEKYLNEDFKTFVVPASDVNASLYALYGNKMKIKHQTFGDGLMNNYIYDEDAKTYTVPILDQIGIYSPKIKSILKQGNEYTLTVGYIRPDDIWQMYIADNKNEMRPEKYMEYILKKTNKGYNIIAIKDSPIDDNWLPIENENSSEKNF